MLSIDIMDDSGEHTTGYTHDVYKVRLDPMGVKIESEKAKSKYSIYLFLLTILYSM